LVEEVDGSPAGFVYKLKFSNNSLSTITGAVATVSFAGDADANGTVDLDEIGDPGASISFTMGGYLLGLISATDGAETFLVGNSDDNHATEADISEIRAYCDTIDTECHPFKITMDYDDDDTGKTVVFDIVGSASGPVATGGLLLNVSTVNLASGANYKVNNAQIDHDDLAGTAASHTTGLRTGGVVTNSKSAAYTIGADNTYECYGGVIYVTDACTITACDNLAAGMNFTVITIGDIAVLLDMQNDDKMVLDGTALNDGEAATNTSTAGDIIACTYYSADGFYCASNGWTGP